MDKQNELTKCLETHKSTAEIIRQSNAKYDDFNFQYNLRQMKQPKGFIAVKSPRDVKVTIKCLKKLELKFTVKSGGHSFEKYSFGGYVSLDRETNIATVEAGVLLGMLTQRLLEFGNYGATVDAFSRWQCWLKNKPSNSIGSLVRYGAKSNFARFEFVIHENDYGLMLKHIDDIRAYFPEMNDKLIQISSYNETVNRVSFAYYTKNSTLSYMKSRSFYVSKFLNEQELTKFSDSLFEYNISFLLETYTGKINEIDSSHTAFCHRNSLYVLQYAASSLLTPEDPDGNETQKQLHMNLEKFRQSVQFMANGECYVNYIDSEESDPFKKFYCNNFRRLVEVKRNYDPKNIFRFPLSIPLTFN
ncbi:hypothetical protein B4U80_13993 [Leptotrombidium deliense]|uniref:Berberine/berberine-like domain-containing protein n=1 Tax=Leptotrombidium deliense TaxID=299467 RepID=A0A443S5R3_9ACAR|nr:hypothetical protein B4U80_13993 [Leptotrombidium deliense]